MLRMGDDSIKDDITLQTMGINWVVRGSVDGDLADEGKCAEDGRHYLADDGIIWRCAENGRQQHGLKAMGLSWVVRGSVLRMGDNNIKKILPCGRWGSFEVC